MIKKVKRKRTVIGWTFKAWWQYPKWAIYVVDNPRKLKWAERKKVRITIEDL